MLFSIYTAPPSVTTGELQVRVIKGNTATLMCHIIAFPEPSVFWISGESHFTNLIRTIHESAIELSSYLTLENVTLDNNGNYTCYANNSFGVGIAIIEMIVSGKMVS